MAPPTKSTLVTFSLFYVLTFNCATVDLQMLPTNTWPVNYGSVHQGSSGVPLWGGSRLQIPYDYNTGYYTGNAYYRTGRELAPQGCGSAWAGNNKDATGAVVQQNSGNAPQLSQQRQHTSTAGEQQDALWSAMQQNEGSGFQSSQLSQQSNRAGEQQAAAWAALRQNAGEPPSSQELLQSSRAPEQQSASLAYSSTLERNSPSGDTHPNKDQFMREQMTPPLPNYALANIASSASQLHLPQTWISYSRLTYPIQFQQNSGTYSGHPVAGLADGLGNDQGQGKASAWGVSSNDAQSRLSPGHINIKWVAPSEDAHPVPVLPDKIQNFGRASQQDAIPAMNQQPLVSRQVLLTNPSSFPFLAYPQYQSQQSTWGYNPMPAERIISPEQANVAYSRLPPLPQQVAPGLALPVTGVIYDPSLMRRIYGENNYVPPVFSLTNELSNRTRQLAHDELEYSNKVLHGEKPLTIIPTRGSGARQDQANHFQNQPLPPNVYRTDPWEPKTNLYVEAPLMPAYNPAAFQTLGARADNTLTPHCRQKRQMGNFWDIYPALLPDSPLQDFEGSHPSQMSQRSMDPLSSLAPGLLPQPYTPLGQPPQQSPWSMFRNPSLDGSGQPLYPNMQSRGAAQGFQQVISGLTQMVPFFSANGIPGLK